MSDDSFPTFSLQYRADLGILVGRWLTDLPPPELQGTYEAMLVAAQAHGNCRFWLLDLRRRPVAGADLNAWFRHQFSPRLPAALTGPLVTAYLAGPHQRPSAESDALELYYRRDATAPANALPELFEDEAEAMAWLRAEQARVGLVLT